MNPPSVIQAAKAHHIQQGTAIICKVILWACWLFAVLTSVFAARFITAASKNLNTFAHHLDGIVIIPPLFAIAICGGMRWWMSRINDPWLMPFPFCIGLAFGYIMQNFGYFLVPEFCIVYQVLGGMLLLAFFPPFVRLTPRRKSSAQTPRSQDA